MAHIAYWYWKGTGELQPVYTHSSFLGVSERRESQKEKSFEIMEKTMKEGHIRVRLYSGSVSRGKAWHIQGIRITTRKKDIRDLLEKLLIKHPRCTHYKVKLMSIDEGYWGRKVRMERGLWETTVFIT